jgi:hypothetical protein
MCVLKAITVTQIHHANLAHVQRQTRISRVAAMSRSRASFATARRATKAHSVTTAIVDISDIRNTLTDVVIAATVTQRESFQTNATNSLVNATAGLESLVGDATSASCLVISSSIISVNVSPSILSFDHSP